MAGSLNEGITGYAAAREAAAWGDLSARGRLKVTGADRLRFLHNQCTNDIKRLRPGEGCYAACLTNKGKMRGDFVALVFDDHILLDTEAQLREPLGQSLERYIISDDVRIEDITEPTGMVMLCGPRRGELMTRLAGSGDIPVAESSMGDKNVAPPSYAHTSVGDLTIAHSFRTGLGDLDIIGPRERIAELKVALAKLAPELSAEALNILRIEAGIPIFGVDMDENTIPNEAGLEARAISYEKGCYLGQETISRIKSIGHVNRHLVGLRLGQGTLPPPKEKILADSVEIGYITSAVASPRLGAVALGYVRRGHEQPGTRVVVAGQAAEISGVPLES
ncbi:MAG: folate-binding protein YgfZ [Verrucomicrobia bacterium]|nr:folate-binding protein YgfZ [Verrucomicrobiota bacterium]